MAINFPDSPTTGDIVSIGNKVWTWNGTTWDVVISSPISTFLLDTDSDTKVEVERTSDDDTVRIVNAGSDSVVVDSSGDITVYNNLTVGTNASVVGSASATAFYGDVTGNITGDVTGGTLQGTLKSPYELWNVVAGAPGTGASHPIDLLTSTAWYYTSNNTGFFELDFRGDSSTTLDSLMSIGEAVTTSVLVTNGATPYYSTNTLVDGSSVTVEWQNAAGPSAGNANQIDTYTFTIIKTASATFTVLGSFTTFG